ncbi:MAG TPA: hypothetical protein DGT23_00210 [Micromonosporaceae bacterium]|nr:hypothetical protein [Micromonosporaceae bacterium]
MSEDVIEFGAVDRPPRRSRVPAGSAMPLAAIGAIAGAASLIGPWQSTSLPLGPDVGDTRQIGAALAAVGSHGAAYMVALTGLITAVSIVLFGRRRVRDTARTAGFALAGSTLAILLSMAYSLSNTSNLADYRLYPPEDLANVDFRLEWGIYVAFAAVLSFGAALVVSHVAGPRPAPRLLEEQAPEPGEMELTVSVYPVKPTL